jgi:hypothetical protein
MFKVRTIPTNNASCLTAELNRSSYAARLTFVVVLSAPTKFCRCSVGSNEVLYRAYTKGSQALTYFIMRRYNYVFSVIFAG